VGVVEGGQLYFVRTDHIGRPVFATNDAGAVVWSATYHPFGGVRVTQGTPIGLRFPGQWFQAESGLHQNWMRDYDPVTGRYIQPDPLGLIDGASVYGYALQSPMRWTDPRGEFIPLLWMGLGWMVGEAMSYSYKCLCGERTNTVLRYVTLGAFGEVFGPSFPKGVRPMGSSWGTSLFSQALSASSLGPLQRHQMRKFGQWVAKRLPIVTGVMLVYDGASLISCMIQSGSDT